MEVLIFNWDCYKLDLMLRPSVARVSNTWSMSLVCMKFESVTTKTSSAPEPLYGYIICFPKVITFLRKYQAKFSLSCPISNPSTRFLPFCPPSTGGWWGGSGVGEHWWRHRAVHRVVRQSRLPEFYRWEDLRERKTMRVALRSRSR